MVLVDRNLKALMKETPSAFENFNLDSVTNIGYDLSTNLFYIDEKKSVEHIELEPGESVFVSSKEILTVPKNCCVRVVLKNSRLRQGLSLDAPVYQPGHHTRIFFRLSNISKDVIEVANSQKYATIIFDELKETPDEIYNGAFVDEFSFKGLAAYQGMYSDQIHKIEKKKNELKDLEKSIYGNVLAILSVFVALFTLLTTNVTAISANFDLNKLLIIDCTLLGCISFLVLLLPHSAETKFRKIVCIAATVLFLGIALLLMA